MDRHQIHVMRTGSDFGGTMRDAIVILAVLAMAGCVNQSAPVAREPRNETVGTTSPTAALGECGRERDSQRRIDACTEVIDSGRLDSQDRAWAMTFRALGYLGERTSEPRQALADAEAAVRTNPNNDYAYRTRGQAYALLGEDRKALADYDAAIRINPTEGLHYFVRGSGYLELRQTDAANRDFAKAIELDPRLKLTVETMKAVTAMSWR